MPEIAFGAILHLSAFSIDVHLMRILRDMTLLLIHSMKNNCHYQNCIITLSICPTTSFCGQELIMIIIQRLLIEIFAIDFLNQNHVVDTFLYRP